MPDRAPEDTDDSLVAVDGEKGGEEEEADQLVHRHRPSLPRLAVHGGVLRTFVHLHLH